MIIIKKLKICFRFGLPLPPKPPELQLELGSDKDEVFEIDREDRCFELQMELHRSHNQATRVRDMLRDKVSLILYDHFIDARCPAKNPVAGYLQ